MIREYSVRTSSSVKKTFFLFVLPCRHTWNHLSYLVCEMLVFLSLSLHLVIHLDSLYQTLEDKIVYFDVLFVFFLRSVGCFFLPMLLWNESHAFCFFYLLKIKSIFCWFCSISCFFCTCKKNYLSLSNHCNVITEKLIFCRIMLHQRIDKFQCICVRFAFIWFFDILEQCNDNWSF